MVWTELKRLENSCVVLVNSYLDHARSLRWVVLVRPNDTALEPFQADEHELNDAVGRLVEMAREKHLL